MLDIRHLKLLLAVAEEGTLTRAASRLHLTQSALSHQLREAERSVGRPLFLRGPRRMTLTAAGDRLLRSARTILEELGAAELEIGGLRKESEGTLRVATECYTCYHWLPSALATFERAHPRVDVQIVAEATRRPVPAPPRGSPRRRDRERLRPQFQAAADAALSRRDGGGASREASALRGAVSFRPGLRFRDAHHLRGSGEDLTIFRDVLGPAGVRPRRWVPIEITEAIVELVKAGQGVSVMARWAAEPYAAGGKLVLRRLTEKGIRRVWSAATRRQKTAAPLPRRFRRGAPRGNRASARSPRGGKPGRLAPRAPPPGRVIAPPGRLGLPTSPC